MKKSAIVYIDGYNLYYGLLKGTPYKWLDLWKFARALLHAEFDLKRVVYFTAPIKTYPYDPSAIDRQKIYLQALDVMHQVEVVQGFYSKNKTLLPCLDERCGTCAVVKGGLVPVYKFEEKRSDVNLAVSVVADAATNAADCLLIVTGDSDQVGAIERARGQFGKTVVVMNPHESVSTQLKTAATYYRSIPRDLPASCQLPDVIPVGTQNAPKKAQLSKGTSPKATRRACKGARNFIRRPAAW